MRHLRIALVVLALGAWAAGPLAGASAAGLLAPTYQSSEPEDGAHLDEPPSEVTATFSEPLDPSSSMIVHDACGNEIHSGPAEVQLNEMTVGIGKTPSGTYHVVYKAIGVAGGAATGTSTGQFDFRVHEGAPCAGGKEHDHHDPDKKDHDDHRSKHDDHDRDGHQDGGTDHTGHGGMTGMPGGHTGHTTGGAMTGGHGNHHDKHGDGKPRIPPTDPTNPPLAAGRNLPVSADPEAVLVGLGLALAVGVLGGWLLRMTGTPA